MFVASTLVILPESHWTFARRCKGNASFPLAPPVRKRSCFSALFEYDSELTVRQDFINSQLAQGRAFFTTSAALSATGLLPSALKSAIARLSQKRLVLSPRPGFFLILHPEDQALGATDPARWIDPLMRFLELDYRVSLLRAAAFHGAGHQAAMVLQVIAPRQLRPIAIGRQRIEFLYQSPTPFEAVNTAAYLGRLKTAAGYAKVAGVELTLLDCCRYFHRAGGMNGVAQSAFELGGRAKPSVLAAAAAAYENAAVRRLGYLLEHFGHTRQADALRSLAKEAMSFKKFDPSLRPVAPELTGMAERHDAWKLILNAPIEVDS
jgi:predicted transcriptional regulator of viral defense system